MANKVPNEFQTLILLLEYQTVVAKYALFNASCSTLYISSSVEACPL